jgi:hypothetical protein
VETQCCFDFHLLHGQGYWAFLHLLTVCTSSFENCLLSSFARLFRVLLILWEVSLLSSLY